MNWDDFANGDDLPENGEPDILCPEGRHVATIEWVGIQSKDWAKKDRNPDGKVLTVKLSVKPGIKPVWESIPVTSTSTIVALCRSAGVHPPRGEWDEKCLKGKAAIFESVIALSKGGNEFVRITKWLPGPEPLPKAVASKPQAKRTPTAKADAAASGGTDDDIPF